MIPAVIERNYPREARADAGGGRLQCEVRGRLGTVCRLLIGVTRLHVTTTSPSPRPLDHIPGRTPTPKLVVQQAYGQEQNQQQRLGRGVSATADGGLENLQLLPIPEWPAEHQLAVASKAPPIDMHLLKPLPDTCHFQVT